MPQIVKKEEVIIARDGTVRAIYSPLVAKLAKQLGNAEIRRASHVEPTAELSEEALTDLVERKFKMSRDLILKHFPDSWWADMSPVGGPVLGPYDTREEALDDEHVWLEEHGIPAPAAAAPATTSS